MDPNAKAKAAPAPRTDGGGNQQRSRSSGPNPKEKAKAKAQPKAKAKARANSPAPSIKSKTTASGGVMTGYESNAELAKRLKLSKPYKTYISTGKCDNEKLPGINGCKHGVHVTEAQHN